MTTYLMEIGVMMIKMRRNIYRPILLCAALLTCSTLHAWRATGTYNGETYHAGGGYYNHNVDGTYHVDGTYQVNGAYPAEYYRNNTFIGVPNGAYYGSGYTAPICQSVQTCTQYGGCVTQNVCN